MKQLQLFMAEEFHYFKKSKWMEPGVMSRGSSVKPLVSHRLGIKLQFIYTALNYYPLYLKY